MMFVAPGAAHLMDGEGTDSEPVPRNLAFWIRYQDAKGDSSERDIRIIKYVPSPKQDLVMSWCFMRAALRTFAPARITDMYWLDTGEVVERPAAFLLDLLDASPLEMALARLNPGLQILAFVARSDGSMHPEETQVMADYVEWVTPAPLHRPTLLARVRPIFPDSRSFLKAIRACAKWPASDRRELVRHLRQLIDADGRLSVEEHDLAAQVIAGLNV